MRRRSFLARVAASIAAAAGVAATRAVPAAQRIASESPRYIYDPERQVMTERVKEGVYQVLAGWVAR